MSDMEAIPPEQATIPWHRAKQLLKRAWDEGYNASAAYGMRIEAEYPKVPRPPNNPYQEDE